MRKGTSSLNPYAASYVPLSRRGAADTKDYSSSAKETGFLGPHHGSTQQNQQYQNKFSQNYFPGDHTLQSNTSQGFYGSSTQNAKNMTEKQIMDDEFDMDLEYLQMTFPGVSSESLSDVYVANKGDLDATIDMLNQLELYTGDSSENLPDTLDIGDVSESASSSESPSQKLKKVAGEVAAGSSSGSLGSALVT